jgi:hypothetical protein
MLLQSFTKIGFLVSVNTVCYLNRSDGRTDKHTHFGVGDPKKELAQGFRAEHTNLRTV